MEKWQTIDEFPDYEVSNMGWVRDIKTKTIRPIFTTSTGYFGVSLKNNGKWKNQLLHRLIASAFVPGKEDGLVINHINGNKIDNSPSNLEWVTREENMEHAFRTGLLMRYEKDEEYFDFDTK